MLSGGARRGRGMAAPSTWGAGRWTPGGRGGARPGGGGARGERGGRARALWWPVLFAVGIGVYFALPVGAGDGGAAVLASLGAALALAIAWRGGRRASARLPRPRSSPWPSGLPPPSSAPRPWPRRCWRGRPGAPMLRGGRSHESLGPARRRPARAGGRRGGDRGPGGGPRKRHRGRVTLSAAVGRAETGEAIG